MTSPSVVRYVDHTYREFSRYEAEGGELIKHKKSTNNFPARLHRMLSDGRNAPAVAWMPHGRAWKIIDKGRLLTEVLPKYYRCTKYESFLRQLNAWGFKRLHQSGPDFGCYYHECFLRNLPKLTCLVRRLPPNKGKTTPFAEGEPNFYRIGARYPLPNCAAEDPGVADEPESKLRAPSLDISAESTSPPPARRVVSAPIVPGEDANFGFATATEILPSLESAEPEEVPADGEIGCYEPSADRIYFHNPSFHGDLRYGGYYGHNYGHDRPQPRCYYNPVDYPFQFDRVPNEDRLPPQCQYQEQRISYSHGASADHFRTFEGSAVPPEPICISHPVGSQGCHFPHSFGRDDVRSGDATCVDPLEPIPISNPSGSEGYADGDVGRPPQTDQIWPSRSA